MRFYCSLNSSYVILGAVLGYWGSWEGLCVNECILLVCRWCLFGGATVSVGVNSGLLVVRGGLSVCWVQYFWDICVYFLDWDSLRFVVLFVPWCVWLLTFRVVVWLTFWSHCLIFYHYWWFFVFLFWCPFYSLNKINRRDYSSERVINHWCHLKLCEIYSTITI